MISVIIPVYNSENCIKKCVQSVLSQTYRNIEVLLIDDGSSDNSFSVCRDLSDYDERVKVFHQENCGVSMARNRGIELAVGEYIAFVDSDDYLDENYLKILLDNAKEHKADICCCDFYEILGGEVVQIETPKVLNSRKIENSNELLRDLVLSKECYGTCVWGKLIHRKLVEKVRFRPLKFGEDQMFMYDLFSLNPTVYLNSYKGYYYVRNENSATMREGRYSILRCSDEFLFRKIMLEELFVKDSFLERMFLEKYAISVHSLATAVELTGTQDLRKEYRQKLIPLISEMNLNVLSKKIRIVLFLYWHLPLLYRCIFQLKSSRI